MKYPIGIQTFEHIRRQGYVYVDKSALVHDLANNERYISSAVPRKLFKIGCNFSSETGTISDWQLEERP